MREKVRLRPNSSRSVSPGENRLGVIVLKFDGGLLRRCGGCCRTGGRRMRNFSRNSADASDFAELTYRFFRHLHLVVVVQPCGDFQERPIAGAHRCNFGAKSFKPADVRALVRRKLHHEGMRGSGLVCPLPDACPCLVFSLAAPLSNHCHDLARPLPDPFLPKRISRLGYCVSAFLGCAFWSHCQRGGGFDLHHEERLPFLRRTAFD